MFDKNKFFSASFRFASFSTVLFASVFFFSDAWKSEAAGDKLKPKNNSSVNRKAAADAKLANFQAEKFLDGVKISWQTSFEKGIIGYRIWRENGAEKQLVNEETVGGSLLKTANDLLENGGEYSIFDREGSFQDFYRIEMIKTDGKTVQTELFGVQAGDLTAKLSETDAHPKGLPGQINRVDFVSAKDEKIANLQISELLANDPSAIKFDVRTDGWYRVEATDLAQLGFQSELTTDWKLFADGIEQPIKINADGSIEFYGRGSESFYSDARVYWLTRIVGAGKRISRVSQSFNKSAQNGWSRTIAERKDRVLRAPGVLNGERENWYAGFAYSVALNQTLNLSEIATESGETATLSVDLQGVGGVSHSVAVILNGVEVGRIDYNYTERNEWSINLPLARLVEGANTVSLRSPVSSDLSLLEAVRISYPRRLKAENNRLSFKTAARQKVKLKGFTNPNVRIFDFTHEENTMEFGSKSRLETDGTYTVTFDSGSSARILTAHTADTQPIRAYPLMLNEASNLRDTANGAKFIIIGHRDIFGHLQELQQKRETEQLTTKLVDITDVYDEFNHGKKSAEAIREFLRYAKENWSVKPDYVMIAGDASVDPRNYSGLGGDTKDIVPTMFVDTWNLEAVTDEMLVDFDGDSVGEIAIGRLPYRTLEELEAMTEKINLTNSMPLSEINTRGVVFVSDAPQGYDFAAASRNIASSIPGSVVPSYIDRGSQDSTIVKNMIMERINSGAIVVNYFGHGQIYNWTNGNILRNTDAPNLNNIKRPSLMTMVACLNGAFAETNLESLAEAVMKTPTGGAFAVWSASASNTADAQELLAKEYHQRVFSGMRLGDAARETKMTTYMPDIRRTYIFFGDPTQRIVRP
jgi:Peptidase family C25